MKNEQNTTHVGGEFVTEDAVRGGLARRRQARASTTKAPRRANRPGTLRRWSVAELIANGIPRPPAEQTAH